MYALALTCHLLAAIIWIGGMFFTYVCLRPSLAETLEPPQPARLLAATLRRFFKWVWAAIAVLLLSGFYMALSRYSLSAGPLWLYLMIGLGIVMMLLFAHIYFAPFTRLSNALANAQPDDVPGAISQIRTIVAINLGIGLLLIVSVTLGRYL